MMHSGIRVLRESEIRALRHSAIRALRYSEIRAPLVVIASDPFAIVIASDPGRLLGAKQSRVPREIASVDAFVGSLAMTLGFSQLSRPKFASRAKSVAESR